MENEDEDEKIVNLRAIAIITTFAISCIILYLQTSSWANQWETSLNIMDETFAKAVVTLKAEFMKRNESTSHIYEIIPALPELCSINKHELEMLHKFAENNSIYAGSYEMKILDTVCKVYHGDVNNYCLLYTSDAADE